MPIPARHHSPSESAGPHFVNGLLGDEDGTSDSDGLAVSANTISQDVSTGGLDGDQFEVLAGGIKTFEAVGTNDAAKIRYQNPSFGGLQFGASYTPNLNGINSGSGNGDLLVITDLDAGDVVEGGVRYKGKLGALGLTAGLTGLHGDVKNESDDDGLGGDDYWQWQAGAVVDVAGFRLGGSYLQEEIAALEARAGGKVFGIQYVNAAWHPNPVARSGMVHISGTDEVMTPDTFNAAYLAGTLIRVVYTEDWRS